MNNKTIMTVGLLATTFSLAMLPAAFATTADPKNGWGKATSEEAGEGGRELGEHASDPNNDGPGNDEREGLGNTAETFTGQKNPDKLGEVLDCVDQDDEDDPEPVDC
jgi:hypothetical protein